MLKTIGIIVAVLIAGILIFATTKPDTFRVQRLASIKAPPEKVFALKLDFLKPFKAHNTVEFTLTAQGDTTHVVWIIDGPANFMSKLIQVFVSMDSMVGKDFESGLANLKAAAEK